MVTQKPFIDIGDPGAPIGSQPWCKYAHDSLCISKRNTDSAVRRFKYSLIEFREFERWKQLADKDGNPFLSWEDYLQYPEPDGLGMSPASAKLVIEESNDNRLLGDVLAERNQEIDAKAPVLQPVGANQYSDGCYNTEKDVTPSRGHKAEYAIRRLRRDRPDIHARVLAGELTAHAGMIEAGFRKPRRKITRVERAQKTIDTWTRTERRALWQHLDLEFGKPKRRK